MEEASNRKWSLLLYRNAIMRLLATVTRMEESYKIAVILGKDMIVKCAAQSSAIYMGSS